MGWWVWSVQMQFSNHKSKLLMIQNLHSYLPDVEVVSLSKISKLIKIENYFNFLYLCMNTTEFFKIEKYCCVLWNHPCAINHLSSILHCWMSTKTSFYPPNIGKANKIYLYTFLELNILSFYTIKHTQNWWSSKRYYEH